MTTLEAVGGSFDFGRVVERTFRVIGDNLWTLAVAALVLFVAPIVVVFGLAAALSAPLKTTTTLGSVTIGGALIVMIGGLMLQGVVIHAVISKLNGRPAGFDDLIKVGLRAVLPLFGLAIVSTFALTFGFVLLLVPGLILCVLWSVASPSLVIEKRGIFSSLQRSRDLTRGHRWAIFGLLVVYLILIFVLSTVGQMLSTAFLASKVQIASGPLSLISLILATLLSALTNGLQSVLGAAGAASLYYELRSIKEGVAPNHVAAVFD